MLLKVFAFKIHSNLNLSSLGVTASLVTLTFDVFFIAHVHLLIKRLRLANELRCSNVIKPTKITIKGSVDDSN